MARPTIYPRRKLLPLTDELVQGIEEYRRTLSPIPSENEATRRVLAAGLVALGVARHEPVRRAKLKKQGGK